MVRLGHCNVFPGCELCVTFKCNKNLCSVKTPGFRKFKRSPASHGGDGGNCVQGFRGRGGVT